MRLGFKQNQPREGGKRELSGLETPVGFGRDLMVAYLIRVWKRHCLLRI